jgi:hypothetical protein
MVVRGLFRLTTKVGCGKTIVAVDELAEEFGDRLLITRGEAG